MIGIYCIQNLRNNKRYVGSSIDIHRRWTDHKLQLRKGQHRNSYLQRSWCKYGEDQFFFSILETCLQGELEEKELAWIIKLGAEQRPTGYNLLTQTSRCTIVSALTRKRKSAAAKKQWASMPEKMTNAVREGVKKSKRHLLAAKANGVAKRDSRPVEECDLLGNVLHVYGSRREAFLANGKQRNVYRVLSGEYSQCKGKVFRYAI